jgi:septal ring-binding cell division protein DamX
MLQLFAIVVAALIASTITSAYGQDVNETQEQKPTEEKQGGEYSGFEEAERQTEGIPNQEANPTPQAPISDLNVQQENQTTTAETTTTAAVEPTSLPGVAMLAGIGAVVAVAIVAAGWYFRRNRR